MRRTIEYHWHLFQFSEPQRFGVVGPSLGGEVSFQCGQPLLVHFVGSILGINVGDTLGL